MFSRSTLLSAFAVMVLASSVPAQDLGPKIAQFAQDHLGKKVGNGECTSLAEIAIRKAGGKHFSDLGPSGPDADYVWGKLVVKLTPQSASAKDIQPGDIIQFRNVNLSQAVKKTGRDGSWSSRTETASFSHHTAVVQAVKGNFVDVLQQNIGSGDMTDAQKRVVQKGKLVVGTFSTHDTVQGATINARYTFTSGTMWVYRAVK